MDTNGNAHTRDLWVNLSYSPCPSGERLGFNERQMNKLAMRCAQFWLAKDSRLLFGHDWRPDGVMRSIGNIVELSAPFEFRDRKLSFPRLLNLVPHPTTRVLDRTGMEAESASEGLLTTRRMYDVLSGARINWDNVEAQPPDVHFDARPYKDDMFERGLDENDIDHRLWFKADSWRWLKKMEESIWNQSPGLRLSILRAFMTRLLSPGIRICFGGKPSGSSGTMTGIIEEALFALCDDRPLYLIGGYGGATADFAAALSHDDSSINYGLSKPLDFCHRSNLKKAGSEELRLMDALTEEFNLPTDNLSDCLPENGMARLCAANHLSPEENRFLFRCTDMESALALIHTGVRRRFGSTRNT